RVVGEAVVGKGLVRQYECKGRGEQGARRQALRAGAGKGTGHWNGLQADVFDWGRNTHVAGIGWTCLPRFGWLNAASAASRNVNESDSQTQLILDAFRQVRSSRAQTASASTFTGNRATGMYAGAHSARPSRTSNFAPCSTHSTVALAASNAP